MRNRRRGPGSGQMEFISLSYLGIRTHDYNNDESDSKQKKNLKKKKKKKKENWAHISDQKSDCRDYHKHLE